MSGESGSLLDIEPTSEPALNPNTLDFVSVGGGGSGGPSVGGGGGGGGGRIGSSMAPAGLSSVPLEPAASGPSVGFGESSAPAVSAGVWSLKYYQPLFDVDTVQVLNRIKGSLLPRPKGAFFELVSANPDLYGPFWVSTTLIFAMAITGNLASFFAFKPTPQHPTWTYNFNQLTLAGSVVYSYVTLLPLLFWLLLRYYEAGKKLVDVVCIYGYTLSVFIPISVLCVLPSDVMRWALVLVGGALSGIFLLSNFHAHLADCFPYGEGDAKKKTYSLLGLMFAMHALLLILFKLYFFHYA